MKDPNNGSDHAPEIREVSTAKEEARRTSSEILSIINLQGKTSKPGPGVAACGDKPADKFYSIHHPWSLMDVPVEDMKKAMGRLNEQLPKKGWKVTSYGPDTSPSKTLELTADSLEKKSSVSIRLLDRTKRHNPGAPEALIYVDLTSECFQVPAGKTVDEY
ncbi:hypothetical protein ACFVT2_32495 [Streptomyces sp. NPDC058000]|uniref:hypothetical protein n=1 Tax=Streptomyces sp. NPDC058000 TaxID=3346299 RepID=UPI0036E35115